MDETTPTSSLPSLTPQTNDSKETIMTDATNFEAFSAGMSAGAKATSPSETAMLMNGGYGGYNSMWQNPFMYLIWLSIFGNGANGWWGNGRGYADTDIAHAMTTNDQLLLSQLQNSSNNTKDLLNNISTNLHADSNQVQASLSAINGAIDRVAGTVGMTGQQVINAVQAGDCNIARAVQDACCENRLAICKQTNEIGQGLTQLGFANQTGFNHLSNSILIDGNMTRQLLSQQNYENTIAQQADKISELRAQAQTAVLLSNNNAQSAALNTTLGAMNTTLEKILDKVNEA